MPREAGRGWYHHGRTGGTRQRYSRRGNKIEESRDQGDRSGVRCQSRTGQRHRLVGEPETPVFFKFGCGGSSGSKYMLAVTSDFNPMKSRRRLANYRTFRSRLDVPLVTVELAFDGQFELTSGDADHLIQLSGGDIMWQKERLLNIGIKSIPSAVKNFAWIDCDILFGRREGRRKRKND